MRSALLLIAALLLAGCGSATPVAPSAAASDPDSAFRTWSDAMSTGDWTRVAELSCAEIDGEFTAGDDQSATALLDAARVQFQLTQIGVPTITGESAMISASGSYQLVLDRTRLQASLGDALLAGGAPAEEIEALSAQAVEFLIAGARAALEPTPFQADFPLVLEEGSWRVCGLGFSPLSLVFPTQN